MIKDDIYRSARSSVAPFRFDEAVARVFDDMIHRSVPFYAEIIRRQVQLILHRCESGARIYDLGCSNGNLGIGLCRQWTKGEFVMMAVDSAQPMLDCYEARLADMPCRSFIQLRCQDIRHTVIQAASAVVLNFTMQFLPLEERDALMAGIYAGLQPGGMLLFCEKITHADAVLADLQSTFYHAFKRENGYSELEISQKREALEKVLIPETLEIHLDRLRRSGFKRLEIWYKWFNFAALVAIK